MNKRINALAIEAREFASVEYMKQTLAAFMTTKSSDHLFNEKFASLLLTDVTDILSSYTGRIIFNDHGEYGGDGPVVAINKHFGVENE